MKFFIVIFLSLTASTSAANILGLFPTFSHSHYLLTLPLFKELAKAGHNITVITLTRSTKTEVANYHEVVPTVEQTFFESFDGKYFCDLHSSIKSVKGSSSLSRIQSAIIQKFSQWSSVFDV